jgi:hypothetical protein
MPRCGWAGEEETGLLAEKFGAPLRGGIYFFSVQFIVLFFRFFCPSPSSPPCLPLHLWSTEYRDRVTVWLLLTSACVTKRIL